MRQYLLALALGLALAAPAAAETIVVSFSDLVSCAPCKQLEAAWRTPDVSAKMSALHWRRAHVDVNTADRKTMQAYGVTSWPVTYLVEVDEHNHILKVYKRRDGAMSAAELLRFLEPPR